jgi:hypothetical protein
VQTELFHQLDHPSDPPTDLLAELHIDPIDQASQAEAHVDASAVDNALANPPNPMASAPVRREDRRDERRDERRDDRRHDRDRDRERGGRDRGYEREDYHSHHQYQQQQQQQQYQSHQQEQQHRPRKQLVVKLKAKDDALHSSSSAPAVGHAEYASTWQHAGPGQPDYSRNRLTQRRRVSYILFKSLDQHDIDISQAQGIWATLPKNKDRVNTLFDASDELYAFFSVNKSGAFQGYARVTCGVDRELTDTEWLKADGQSTWGGVFKVDWLCRRPLLFTHIPPNLTNPWNDGKHVKIGFDGTELPAQEGDQLRRLFDGQMMGGMPSYAPHYQQQQQRPSRPPRSAGRPVGQVKLEPSSSSSPVPTAARAKPTSSTDGQPKAPPPKFATPVPQTQADVEPAESQTQMDTETQN